MDRSCSVGFWDVHDGVVMPFRSAVTLDGADPLVVLAYNEDGNTVQGPVSPDPAACLRRGQREAIERTYGVDPDATREFA